VTKRKQVHNCEERDAAPLK